MKKYLKKMLLVVLLATISIPSFSKIKGLGELLKVVTKIYTQQQLMGTEQIQQGISLINQIDNQVRQIQNQYEMLKRLEQQISQGNILYLEDYFREFGYMIDSYESIMLETEKLSDKYMELFERNPKEFEKIGVTQDYMEKMDKNIREARQMSNTALYDVMTSKGFSAKLGADEQNLKALLNASKSSTGVVETLQITNSLLGQISANISQLGLLSETATKAQAMSTNTESQEIENAKKELDQLKKIEKENNQYKIQELKNKYKKSITL